MSVKAQNNDIQKLYDNRDYIQLSHLDIENWDINQLPSPLLRAYVYSAMACYEKSNNEIAFILASDSITKDPDLMVEILNLQAVNYFKTYQYKQAAGSYKKLLDDYDSLLDEEITSIQNMYRLYDALSTVKPLQAEILRDTKISIKPDKKGFPLVLVHTPEDSVSLVFDTGASFSCVTKSVAKRLGISILTDSLMGGGATGNMEFASIGVADTMYLGDILYENVVFLVLEDEKLTFPEHDYTVNGTLGFPEMKILPAMKIHKNGMLEISKNDDKHKNNMMFSEDNQIIVQVNDSLLFWLDTGAARTNLFVNYYNKNKEQIDKEGEFTKKVINGMGGSKEFPLYMLKKFPIKINMTVTVLPKISVFVEQTLGWAFEYDGSLGQDVISQYDYMLLDFENMYFSLENAGQSK